jgi:hypothetical protein
MSNAQRTPLTPEEVEARKEFLRGLGIGPKPDATVVPLRRAALGLAPGPGPDDDPPEGGAARGGPAFRSTLWDNKTDAFLDSAHSVRAAYQQFDALAGTIIDLHNRNVDEINGLQDWLKAKFAEVELEQRRPAR